MTLVFLYGPPAAGKLTVARELARLTGFRVFHNHLTNDLAHEIFPERDADLGVLVARLRLDVFEAAARAGVSMISTFVYAHPDDDAFLAKVAAPYVERGGRVAYVQLLPTREMLRARVDAPSRSEYRKLREWSVLEGLLDGHDLATAVPGSLAIDNSDVTPEDAARRIAERLDPSDVTPEDAARRIAERLDPAVLPSIGPS